MKTELLAAFIIACALTGCDVKLRDKNEKDEPKELVVEELYTLPQGENLISQRIVAYDRLVLKKGARFITKGANVRLEIKELIADDATIATFAEHTAAGPGQPGRPGGHLEIVVGEAYGKLAVELRGETGGDGANGADPDESMKGARGRTGRDWHALPPGYYYVNDPGEFGHRGEQGATGKSGENGFPGGNSGSANIRIDSGPDFQLKVQTYPGLGGKPGIGAKGGKGGDGGIGGKTYDGSRLPTGLTGENGPDGPDGSPGPNGIAEKFCTHLEGQAPNCTN